MMLKLVDIIIEQEKYRIDGRLLFDITLQIQVGPQSYNKMKIELPKEAVSEVIALIVSKGTQALSLDANAADGPEVIQEYVLPAPLPAPIANFDEAPPAHLIPAQAEEVQF